MAVPSLAGNNALAIKAHNMRTLLLTLLHQQPISRVRLARQIGLSTTTVTNLVTELVEQGVVTEDGTDLAALTSGAGRLPRALRLVPESRYALGIFIGVRRVRVVLGDLAAHIVDRAELPHRAGAPAEQTLARVVALAHDLLQRNGLQAGAPQLVGVGVGASGLVATDTGVNLLAPSLGWRDVPLRAIFTEGLGLPTVVDNNVRTMALAESLYGAGQNVRALVFVYAQVGVGAGLVVDGKIYRGADYGAGEIGHWTILPHGGAQCRCGNTGCLETLISEPAIVEAARAIDSALVAASDRPIEAIFAAVRAGHPDLRAVLEERARYVGIALANLVDVLNPEMALLGGLLHRGFDLFQPVVEQTLQQRTFAGLGQHMQLRPSAFGAQAGEIGAVALALHALFFHQQSAL